MQNLLSGWQKIQQSNFSSLEKLCTFLELTPEQSAQVVQNKNFPLNLPLRLAQKIPKKTLDDPLFRQFVPLKAESERSGLFVKDPVGDCRATLSSKCLKKYEGRVLLVTTGACAMHCRFCFRQNFSYASFHTGFAHELKLIEQDPTIKEVILSGGDPLSLKNTYLQELLKALTAIAHVKRIRFHTRFPIGIPERIDEEFLSILATHASQIWFVIHCNHPHELDAEVLSALKQVQKLGIPILNQTVLLKGVNDSIDTLQNLCEKLVDHGIMPYYLHQLDRVEGAAHFEVDQEVGKQLIEELNKRLSGYGVPKYVQEIASAPSKSPIY